MFKIFWYVFIAIILTFALSWMLENNGFVTILWLGYEIKTDILTALTVTIIFVLAILAIIYSLAKLFSIRLPKSAKKEVANQ